MSAPRTLIPAALLLIALSGASTAAAQAPVSPDPASAASDAASQTAGPRLALTAVGVRHAPQGMAAWLPTQPVSMGKPMALMIVGGAAFVLGALIGRDVGTLFMIGGTVSFLIGLYEYIK